MEEKRKAEIRIRSNQNSYIHRVLEGYVINNQTFQIINLYPSRSIGFKRRKKMDVIDKKNFKIICKKCGITEEQFILEKGSLWNGLLWQKLAKFQNFETIWIDDHESKPNILKANCKQCGQEAKVEVRYSGFNIKEPSLIAGVMFEIYRHENEKVQKFTDAG